MSASLLIAIDIAHDGSVPQRGLRRLVPRPLERRTRPPVAKDYAAVGLALVQDTRVGSEGGLEAHTRVEPDPVGDGPRS